MVGSISPRNVREKIIFQYFDYLRKEDYKSAYSLVSPKHSGTYVDFVTSQTRAKEKLPSMISIADERQSEDSSRSSLCNYTYKVYSIDSDTPHRLISVVAGLDDDPISANSCILDFRVGF